jgi:hypothetical protein
VKKNHELLKAWGDSVIFGEPKASGELVKLDINERYSYSTQDELLEGYDKFQANVDVDEHKNKSNYDASVKILGESASKVVSLQARKKQAEDEKVTAQECIDHFAGLSLDQLKGKFKEIYAGGTNDGRNNPKYTAGNLETMGNLLGLIKDKMPNKILDSVFAGYEKDINDNVRAKLVTLKMVVEPFLTSGTTLKEMVKAQQYYNEDTARKSLTDVQSKLGQIKNIRILTPVENLVYDEIGAYIQTGKFDTLTTPQQDDDKDKPTSTLKIADLVEVLKGTKELKESDLTTLTD